MRRKRKNIRLGNFDYSSEFAHYVTICTKDRQWYFGEIINGKMAFSPVGEIVGNFWAEIPDHFPHVILDEFIIMPNHMHGIIKLDYSTTGTFIETPIGTCIEPPIGTCIEPPIGTCIEPPIGTCIEPPIGTCHGMSLLPNNTNIRQKQNNKFGHPVPGSVSVIINHYKSAVKRWCNKNGFEYFLWQPRFYDHIVNNKNDLIRIRKYIKSNPARVAQLNKI